MDVFYIAKEGLEELVGEDSSPGMYGQPRQVSGKSTSKNSISGGLDSNSVNNTPGLRPVESGTRLHG